MNSLGEGPHRHHDGPGILRSVARDTREAGTNLVVAGQRSGSPGLGVRRGTRH